MAHNAPFSILHKSDSFLGDCATLQTCCGINSEKWKIAELFKISKLETGRRTSVQIHTRLGTIQISFKSNGQKFYKVPRNFEFQVRMTT